MKKSVILMSAAFVLAIGSAFTTKVLNPTGYYNTGSSIVSGATDNSACQVQTSGSLCTINFQGNDVSPVYDTEDDATNQVSTKILRHN
jgi:hypothetical protein